MYYSDNISQGYTENDIWQLLKAGKQEALSLLVYRYYDDLFRYGCGLCEKITLVEDVIQDLFCDLWQKRAGLGDVSLIKPYLFISLRRRIFRKLKAERNITAFDGDKAEFNFDVEFSPEDLMIKKQDKEKLGVIINSYMNQLSSRQREAIYLRFYENLGYQAISQIMNITVPYLYLLIHKSVGKMRKMLLEQGVTGL